MGWRMPSLAELRTLVNAAGLPSGHPFAASGTLTFWTSTTVTDATTQAYEVAMGNPTATFTAIKGTDSRRTWCVRGGEGYDAY